MLQNTLSSMLKSIMWIPEELLWQVITQSDGCASYYFLEGSGMIYIRTQSKNNPVSIFQTFIAYVTSGKFLTSREFNKVSRG